MSEKQLAIIDHIRRRPGMYLGALHLKGFKEIITLILESVLADCKKRPIISFTFYRHNCVELSIKNFNSQNFIAEIEQLILNKTNNYKLACLIALSNKLKIVANNNATQTVVNGVKGKCELIYEKATLKNENLFISFELDKEIFGSFEIVYEQILGFLKQFAYLNPFTKIIAIDKATKELQRNIFYAELGILNQLNYIVTLLPNYIPQNNFHLNEKIGACDLKVGICFNTIWYGETLIKTFANNTETVFGGTLNNAINCGVLLAIKKLAEKEKVNIKINKASALLNLFIIAAIKGVDIEFSGSTKQKLFMPQLQLKIKNMVYKKLSEFFEVENEIATSVIEKFRKYHKAIMPEMLSKL